MPYYRLLKKTKKMEFSEEIMGNLDLVFKIITGSTQSGQGLICFIIW